MCAIQRNQPPEQEQNQQRPQPQYHFRWEVFVGIPVLVLALLWLLNGIAPSFEFENLMDTLDVVSGDRYVRLACLGVLLIATILAIKAFGNNRD